MSEISTTATQELLQERLPRLAAVEDEAQAGEAYGDYHQAIERLVDRDIFDEAAVRELAIANAENLSLDIDAADRVFETKRSTLNYIPRGQAVPTYRLWEGSGSSVTLAGLATVHYINRPGVVEEKYGPGYPYILRKLGWTVLSQTLGWGSPDVNPGYSKVRELLVTNGFMKPEASLHIGAISKKVNDQQFYASASGILPSFQHDGIYQGIKRYSERAQADKEAGLYDWAPDRRAGLYDTVFAGQTIDALNGIDHEDTKLKIVGLGRYSGVDIN